LVGGGEIETLQFRQGRLGVAEGVGREGTALRILGGEEAPVHDAEQKQRALDLDGLSDHRILARGPQLGDEDAGSLGQVVAVGVDAGPVLADQSTELDQLRQRLAEIGGLIPKPLIGRAPLRARCARNELLGALPDRVQRREHSGHVVGRLGQPVLGSLTDQPVGQTIDGVERSGCGFELSPRTEHLVETVELRVGERPHTAGQDDQC
jgi:hypothetical protein